MTPIEAIDFVDDFIARCNGDDRGACEPVNVLRRALASTTPDQGDERRAFHRHIQATEQREALLWSQVWANSMQDGPMPAHMEGKYLIDADQKAWLAWQAARALSSAQPMAQEAIAWSLRFDDDPRLNLSTVFDTEDEAKNYAARCGSATPVPLFAAPQPSQGAHQVIGSEIPANGSASSVVVWSIGEACHKSLGQPSGDYIDRGLILLRELKARGLTLIKDATPHQPVSAEAGKVVEPFGYVTKTRAGVQHFYPDAPYLDNAVECVTVYASPSESVSGEVSEEDMASLWLEHRPPGLSCEEHYQCAFKFARAVLALAGSGGKANG